MHDLPTRLRAQALKLKQILIVTAPDLLAVDHGCALMDQAAERIENGWEDYQRVLCERDALHRKLAREVSDRERSENDWIDQEHSRQLLATSLSDLLSEANSRIERLTANHAALLGALTNLRTLASIATEVSPAWLNGQLSNLISQPPSGDSMRKELEELRSERGQIAHCLAGFLGVLTDESPILGHEGWLERVQDELEALRKTARFAAHDSWCTARLVGPSAGCSCGYLKAHDALRVLDAQEDN